MPTYPEHYMLVCIGVVSPYSIFISSYKWTRNKYNYGMLNGIKSQGYKTSFMLNSAEHEISFANKYENANYCWHILIYSQRKFHSLLCSARKNLQLLAISDLLA